MNIGILTSSFPANSNDARATAGLFVRDFALALSNAGHAVRIIVPEKNVFPKETTPGISVTWFPWLGGKKRLSYMKPYYPHHALMMLSLFIRGMRALAILHHEKPFDHIIAMWAVPGGLLAARFKQRFHVPYTTWCLGSDIWTYGRYPFLRRIVADVLKKSDFIFADGIALGKEAQKISGRECPFLASSRKLDFSNEAKAPIEKNGFCFLFIGRYARVKGVDILIDAMARFVRSEGQGHLYLFGGGPLRSNIEKRIKHLDLCSHVTLGGYAANDTVVRFMHACDAVVIPSRMESIPVVLSDAFQAQKPVIVSDVGDMGAIVKSYNAGLVVPAGDPDALCSAMISMAHSPEKTYVAGIRKLSEEFNIAESARTWLELTQ